MTQTVNPVDMLQRILDGLDRMPSVLRQGIADEIWAKLPTHIDEFAFSAALAAGVPLVVAPQYSTFELITGVVVAVPTGATALVQLGSMVLPFGPGVFALTPVRKILGPSDTRTLTLAGGGGAAALWLTGEQQPTFGVIGP